MRNGDTSTVQDTGNSASDHKFLLQSGQLIGLDEKVDSRQRRRGKVARRVCWARGAKTLECPSGVLFFGKRASAVWCHTIARSGATSGTRPR